LLLLRFRQCEHDSTVVAANWFDDRLTALHQQHGGCGTKKESSGKVRVLMWHLHVHEQTLLCDLALISLHSASSKRLIETLMPRKVLHPLHKVPHSYMKCKILCAQTVTHTYRWTEGTPTWHHAAHDKKGKGGLRAPRLVPLFLGCHLSLPQSILFWEALLNDILKSDGDGQFPAYMQHLQA